MLSKDQRQELWNKGKMRDAEEAMKRFATGNLSEVLEGKEDIRNLNLGEGTGQQLAGIGTIASFAPGANVAAQGLRVAGGFGQGFGEATKAGGDLADQLESGLLGGAMNLAGEKIMPRPFKTAAGDNLGKRIVKNISNRAIAASPVAAGTTVIDTAYNAARGREINPEDIAQEFLTQELLGSVMGSGRRENAFDGPITRTTDRVSNSRPLNRLESIQDRNLSNALETGKTKKAIYYGEQKHPYSDAIDQVRARGGNEPPKSNDLMVYPDDVQHLYESRIIGDKANPKDVTAALRDATSNPERVVIGNEKYPNNATMGALIPEGGANVAHIGAFNDTYALKSGQKIANGKVVRALENQKSTLDGLAFPSSPDARNSGGSQARFSDLQGASDNIVANRGEKVNTMAEPEVVRTETPSERLQAEAEAKSPVKKEVVEELGNGDRIVEETTPEGVKVTKRENPELDEAIEQARQRQAYENAKNGAGDEFEELRPSRAGEEYRLLEQAYNKETKKLDDAFWALPSKKRDELEEALTNKVFNGDDAWTERYLLNENGKPSSEFSPQNAYKIRAALEEMGVKPEQLGLPAEGQMTLAEVPQKTGIVKNVKAVEANQPVAVLEQEMANNKQGIVKGLKSKDYSTTTMKAMADDPELAAMIKEGRGGADFTKKKAKAIELQKVEAIENVNKLNDADFKARWSDTSRELRGEQSAIEAHYAYQRAQAMGDTELAGNILRQITDGALAEGTSGAGRMLRMAREFAWNKADAPTKQNIIVETVNKTRKKGGMPDLNEVELSQVEALARRGVEADELYKQAYEAGVGAKGDFKNMTVQEAEALVKAADDAKFKAESIYGEVNNELAKFLPKDTLGSRAASWQKTAMLSNPIGRVRDIVQTKGAQSMMSADKVVTNSINRVVNKLTDHKYGLEETMFKGGEYGTGLGLKKAGRNAVGNAHATQLMGGESRITQMTPTNKVQRLVSGSTEIATDLTEGMRTSKAYALADAMNKKAGYKGDELAVKNILDARFNKDIRKASREYSDRASFLQDNAVSDAMQAFANTIDRQWPNSGLGKLLRNQIIPFVQVSGGKIHESLTKRNVIANTAGIFKAAREGNVAGVTENIGRLITNGGLTAAGFALWNLGSITTEDANGDSYDGAYLKVGDQYVPLGVLPAGAGLPLLVGAAIGDEKIRDSLAADIQTVAGTTDTALGKNPLVKAVTEGFDESTGAKLTFGMLGQFIPALTTSVNAVTDTVRQFSGDDTGFNTKVKTIDQETGKEKTDKWATEWNKVLAKIPGVREAFLERSDEKTGKNVLDVLTQGSHANERAKELQAYRNGGTDWYDVVTNDGIPKIKRKDGQTPSYSGDISGLSQDEVNLLSMTKSEVERDAESDKWGTQTLWYQAQTKALNKELEKVQQGYNEGKKSKQDIEAVKEKIEKAEYMTKVSNINDQATKNTELMSLLKDAGVETVYDLDKLYSDGKGKDISLTEWRELASTNPALHQALAIYDNGRTNGGTSKGKNGKNKYYYKGGSGKGKGKGSGKAEKPINNSAINADVADLAMKPRAINVTLYNGNTNAGKGIVKGIKAPQIQTEAKIEQLQRGRVRT